MPEAPMRWINLTELTRESREVSVSPLPMIRLFATIVLLMVVAAGAQARGRIVTGGNVRQPDRGYTDGLRGR